MPLTASGAIYDPFRELVGITPAFYLRWSSLCPYRPLPHSCQLIVGFAAFYFIKGRWTAALPHCRIAFGGGFDSFDMDHLKLGAEFSCA